MTESTADKATSPRLRVIFAACIGSALEWYDFFLYGTAAALVFGELFFPKGDPVVGTLLAFLTFGVGFVVRPLGGILFGVLGDRYGRKPVLVATLLMIGIGTTLIGVLPTYAQIGYWAPFLLVLMRVIQGLGAGAEYGGAVIYLVENAPAASARLLGQLCAARRVDRQSARRRRLRAGDAAAARRPDVVGLAPAVPGELPADRGRHFRPAQGGGNPCLYRGRASRAARSSRIRRWKRCAAIRAISSSCSARGWRRTGSAISSRCSA